MAAGLFFEALLLSQRASLGEQISQTTFYVRSWSHIDQTTTLDSVSKPGRAG
jgi:hypothetical protein